MSLGHGYIQINSTPIPNPKSTSLGFGRHESRYNTQAGNSYVLIRGTDKLNLGLEFNATSRLKTTLQTYYASATAVTVQVANTSYSNVYISSFEADLVENSELTPGTNGLWEVKLTLEQL